MEDSPSGRAGQHVQAPAIMEGRDIGTEVAPIHLQKMAVKIAMARRMREAHVV